MAITPQQNKIKFRNEYKIFENEIICKIADELYPKSYTSLEFIY